MKPSSELRSDYSQGNLHDGGDAVEAVVEDRGDGVEAGVGDRGDGDVFKYFKKYLSQRKKYEDFILKIMAVGIQ